MGLPHRPESIASMRDRYKKALVKIWETDKGFSDRPGLHREHVFDFEDGMRLLVSTDRMPDLEIITHISASCGDRDKQMTIMFSLFEEEVLNKWRQISGAGERFHFHLIGLSQNNIPHWYVCGGEQDEEERHH